MPTFKLWLAVSLLAAPFWAASEPPLLPPKFGQPLATQDVSSLTVWPDGSGLPQGSGTVATGQAVYEQQCLACHGLAGNNGINTTLAGGQVSLTELPKTRTVGSYWPYATTLFDYVRRTMPYREPGSLSNDEVYAVVAYLLFLNDVIEEELVLDAAQLSKVVLPNRQRFYSDYDLPP